MGLLGVALMVLVRVGIEADMVRVADRVADRCASCIDQRDTTLIIRLALTTRLVTGRRDAGAHDMRGRRVARTTLNPLPLARTRENPCPHRPVRERASRLFGIARGVAVVAAVGQPQFPLHDSTTPHEQRTVLVVDPEQNVRLPFGVRPRAHQLPVIARRQDRVRVEVPHGSDPHVMIDRVLQAGDVGAPTVLAAHRVSRAALGRSL